MRKKGNNFLLQDFRPNISMQTNIPTSHARKAFRLRLTEEPACLLPEVTPLSVCYTVLKNHYFSYVLTYIVALVESRHMHTYIYSHL